VEALMHVRPSSRCLWVAVLCLLAGAGGQFSAIGFADASPPLSVQWGFSTDADPANTTVPAVHAGQIYVTLRGAVWCLDGRTGAERWHFRPESGAVNTSPIVWEDLVIVGATDASLYAFDARSGAEAWRRTCAAAISSDPVILDGMLMVGAGEMVYAIKPSSGKATWICALATPAKFGPVTDGSMLYFLGHDGSIQSVDARAGRYRWRVSLLTGPRTFRPLIGGRRAIVATGNRVYGVARSGAVSWTAEMPTAVGAAPTVHGDLLYVPCVDGRVYRLRARSGAPQRYVDLHIRPNTPSDTSRVGAETQAEYAITAPPLVTESIIAVGTADGLLCCFDREAGRVTWTYRCRAPEQDMDEAAEFGIYAPIIAVDESLLCLTGGGELYRLSASAPDAAGPRFGAFEPEPGSAKAGGRSVTAAFAVVDDVSGVDPTSVRATIDGSPVAVEFDMVTGVGVIRSRVLRDGPHIVSATAKDYRGNVGTAEWSFLTDVSLGTTPEQATRSRTIR
jgi:outer membrane protein assembly factor BamB